MSTDGARETFSPGTISRRITRERIFLPRSGGCCCAARRKAITARPLNRPKRARSQHHPVSRCEVDMRSLRSSLVLLGLAGGVLASLAAPLCAAQDDNFYKGRTVTIVVGFSP